MMNEKIFVSFSHSDRVQQGSQLPRNQIGESQQKVEKEAHLTWIRSGLRMQEIGFPAGQRSHKNGSRDADDSQILANLSKFGQIPLNF